MLEILLELAVRLVGLAVFGAAVLAMYRIIGAVGAIAGAI